MLELPPDAFSFDDTLPILRARPKVLGVQDAGGEMAQDLFAGLRRLAEPATAGADVTFAAYNPLAPALPAGPALVVVQDAGKSSPPLQGLLVAENDPLMENLAWQGLLTRDTLGVPFRDGDRALLWQGARPLIFLRPTERGPQLIFNFDLRQSNAARLPAFPLLVHRFLATLRAEKIGPEARVTDTREAVPVAGVGVVTAPERPDFFSAASPDGTPLLAAAAQFGDPREADLRQAGRGQSDDPTLAVTRAANARGEELDPLWAALLAGLMIGNWFATGRSRRAG
jgi:hypothetical protein